MVHLRELSDSEQAIMRVFGIYLDAREHRRLLFFRALPIYMNT